MKFYPVARANKKKGIIGVEGSEIKKLTCGQDNAIIVEHNLHQDGDSVVQLHDKVFVLTQYDILRGSYTLRNRDDPKKRFKIINEIGKFTPKNVVRRVIEEAVKDGICVGD